MSSANANPGVREFFARASREATDLYLSAISIGEFRQGYVQAILCRALMRDCRKLAAGCQQDSRGFHVGDADRHQNRIATNGLPVILTLQLHFEFVSPRAQQRKLLEMH